MSAMILLPPFFEGAEAYCLFIRERGLSADFSLKPVQTKWLKAIRRLHLALPLPFKSVWFGEWRKGADTFDLLVMHSADALLPVAEYLRKQNRFRRIVLWYWNPTRKGSDPTLATRRGFEVWSFDPSDAERLALKLNTTYSFRELEQLGASSEPLMDFYFLGADKGRAERLAGMARLLDDAGFTHEISVVGHPDHGRLPEGLKRSEAVSYPDLLKREAGARCLIEITQVGQAGPTLRTIEALFLGKKLVTDNRLIMNSQLYDPSRVFVIGHDSWAGLTEFMAAPINPPGDELLRDYDFAGWLHRIAADEPLG